ncbi:MULTISPECIES: RNA helicase [unclassified Frondihabitans]|uniref:DEAD/DEAH box helicase n=1 Tax=unclassified Frondihabitans TaxID=2626248 RepID=UPI000F4D901D|nr:MULTISPECIES: DEAD/DEAH box helicase [unclassified Frondihabitans]RPE74973.1 ATP-dependent RNA helicase HelY [Frondihabitans sp. PhB153]RPF04217.1 ATP-dependent RNA helicase HelY [Frondihabitans sp. PhB161]
MTSSELSPSERFAASRARTRTPQLQGFRERLGFALDGFQIAACEVVEAGRSVLVAAPTGAGKTLVAEFAIHLAMQHPRDKVFYTAPMKALSNQKYQELVAEYGASEVGLLTGDTNVNSRARIVVMTTEVLRNMLYAGSDLLTDLRWVVLDEVHFLGDRFRGAVWEEVIIHLPLDVRMVSLSATVSNAEEFGDWLQTVRGDTDVIVSEERPVPLQQHVLVGSKYLDLFDSTGKAATNRVNPELVRAASLSSRPGSRNGRPGSGSHGYKPKRDSRPQSSGPQNFGRMDRWKIVELLDGKNLLPAIFFVFSRVGCDQAVRQVLRSGIRLTTAADRDEIREIVDEHCRTLRDEDLAVLGYYEWVEGLERGVAAHHAGLLPAFKEVVEELFQKKLVKVVFATETLALGINMPARSVVLEKLEKYNGESRVPITPGEYTQLTGRAGRRGIDIEGHSVIQWAQGLDPQAVAALASRRTYPLNSSFRPTYNMAVNLIERFGRSRTREVLETSFAQFQADRAVVDLARKVRSQQQSLDGYAKSMECHLGDFGEYMTLRQDIAELEKQGASRSEVQSRKERDSRQEKITALRRQLRQHVCHNCPEREQHARWAERWYKLKKQTDQLSAQIRSRTGAVAKVFDRVTDVLVDLGYLVPRGAESSAGSADRIADSSRLSRVAEVDVAAPGKTLRRIYGDRDLLVAECLRRGSWNSLDAPQLAAMAATLVYEPRRDEGMLGDRYLPPGEFRTALDRTRTIWAELDDLEQAHRLPGTLQPSPGIALAMYHWARGASLDTVLDDAELAAGDFVRWTKQTIDLLDQLSVVADPPVGPVARKALDAVRRGIVAYTAV